MDEDRCAACDCTLGEDRTIVVIRGEPVEVCCEECAIALNEAALGLHPPQQAAPVVQR